MSAVDWAALAADSGDASAPVVDRSTRRLVGSPADPLPNAEQFVEKTYGVRDGRALLVCHGGALYAWDGGCWTGIEEAQVRSDFYTFFRDAEYFTDAGGVKRFEPNRHKVADLFDALRGSVFLPRTVAAPAWLDGGPVPANEMIACLNGLLHWPTKTLHRHTPGFFVHHAVPFSFDAEAPAPTRWLGFLQELWPEDTEAVETLQDLFGYMVSGDTAQQKAFLLVGPKRSGKGTIGRVMTGLLGSHHVAGPTLSGLATNFGLQPLIGKPVALVADARLHKNQDALVERLLSITGEDLLTIDRKYQEPWTGRLPTRFVILTNELPRLADTSGALASRFVVLTMQNSFYGKEDPHLIDALLPELPGVFNWALEGLARLRLRGHFVSPQSSTDAIRELEDLGSPVATFLKDCCTVGPGCSATVNEVYNAWRRWCEDGGRDHPGTVQSFGRDLRAVVPGMNTTQSGSAGARERRYHGLRLGTTTGVGETADNSAEHRVHARAWDPESGHARDGTRTSPLLSQVESSPATPGADGLDDPEDDSDLGVVVPTNLSVYTRY